MRKICLVILLFSTLANPLAAADHERDVCCNPWKSISKTNAVFGVALLASLGVLGSSIYGLVWSDQTQYPRCGDVIDHQHLFDHPVCLNASRLEPPFICDAFSRLSECHFYNGSRYDCLGELQKCCQSDNSYPMCQVLNLPDKSIMVTEPHLVNKNEGIFAASIVGTALGSAGTIGAAVGLGLSLCD